MMKQIIAMVFLLSMGALQAGQQGFCVANAKKWQQFLHNRVLDEVGVIQGYNEETSYQLKTVRHDMDNLTETYSFVVDAENDELDTWAWGYEVTIEVWLNAGGTARFCDVINAEYQGVLE